MEELKKAWKFLCTFLKLEPIFVGDYILSGENSNLKIDIVKAITFRLRIETLVGKSFEVSSRGIAEFLRSGEIWIDNFQFQYRTYYRFIHDYTEDYWEIWEVREYESLKSPFANELIDLILKLL